MALSVVLTIGGSNYDVGDWVVANSLSITEDLCNEEFVPNTNKAKFALLRYCPYIDEIIEETGDIAVSISQDSEQLFAGYLTNDHSWGISERGAQDLELSCEDPGIVKLKRAWTSVDGLKTNMVGFAVCNPANTSQSVVHKIASLADVSLTTTLPTISDTVYLVVLDKDGKTYWDVLAQVLLEFGYVFYFDRDGKLCLYDLTSITGDVDHLVSTQGTILTDGGEGIVYQKRLYRVNEVDVSFSEVETLASATILNDTTNQSALNTCNIVLAAGEYYPTGATADDYAVCDYYLEDGREILAVGGITADVQAESGITVEYESLGKALKLRLHNTAGVPKTITRLKVTGSNVVVKAADAKVIAGEAGKQKKEIKTANLTTKNQAQCLGNLFYYLYKNSQALYSFRSFHGVLYPAAALYPGDTLYPLGDKINIGDKMRILDLVFTGLDTNCVVLRKSWIVGKIGAKYEAIGIGGISLNDNVSCHQTAYLPKQEPPALSPPLIKLLSSLEDAVDFDGQYGIYDGQRYVGTMPDTWTRETVRRYADVADDTARAALTGMIDGDTVYQTDTRQWYLYASGWQADGGPQMTPADIVTYAPKYLGRYNAAHPATHNPGDWWLVYDTDDSTILRGVYYDNNGTAGRISAVSGETGYTTDPVLLSKLTACIADVGWCEKHDYGIAANYGIAAFFEALAAVTAFIENLYLSYAQITGKPTLGSLAALDSLAYSALTGKPTLGSLAALDSLAYSALTGKPTLGELAALDSLSWDSAYITGKPTLGSLALKNSIVNGDITDATINVAKLGTTIIDGGHIVTSLLTADIIKGLTGIFTNINISGKASLRELVLSGVTAGNNIVKDSGTLALDADGDQTYVKKYSFNICTTGIVRVTTTLDDSDAAAATVYCKVYLNGSPLGAEHSVSNSSGSWVEDLTISETGTLELWGNFNERVDKYIYTSIKYGIAENLGILKWL